MKHTNAQQIKIGRAFVNHHKNSNVMNWDSLPSGNLLKKYTYVYAKLLAGVYGKVHDGHVEISSTNTKEGKPILFDIEGV